MAKKKIENQHIEFPRSRDNAQTLYRQYQDLDPYPEIDATLLNSADIADYAKATGMIFPFDPSRLGTASYEMVIGGEYYYWDDEKRLCSGTIERSRTIPLKRNSIVFVSTKEEFNLPHYIGVRFNLRVRHVHRGLLLGTGPLVDPGFTGKLMVPIHNLTENDYELIAGEDLISVEFTKISRNVRFSNLLSLGNFDKPEAPRREGKFQPNSKKNSEQTFGDLLKRSLPVGIGQVISSLSGSLIEANKLIKENKNLLDKYKKYLSFGIIITSIAVATLYVDINSLITDSNKYVSDASMVLKKTEKQDSDLRNLITKDEFNDKIVGVEELVKQYEDNHVARTRATREKKDKEIRKLEDDIRVLTESVASLREELEQMKNMSQQKSANE